MSRPEDEKRTGAPSGADPDPAPSPEPDDPPPPWPQRLYENIWLWAGVALVFWFLSYVVWGMVDLFVLPGG